MNAIEAIGWATVLLSACGAILLAVALLTYFANYVSKRVCTQISGWLTLVSYMAWCKGDHERARELLRSALNEAEQEARDE